MPKRKNSNINTRSGFSAALRKPAVQLVMVAIVAFIVYLIASAGGSNGGSNSLASSVSTDEAYQMYQQSSTFTVDVRTQQEWDEYHAPNTTLIPLDQLQDRLSEVPKDKKILVVCRSGNRSQQGRDILLSAGYNATNMTGGLKEWYAKGYPIEGAPAQ